jgi:HSP20 family protein
MTTLTEDVKRTLTTIKERVDQALDNLRPERDRDRDENRTMARRIFHGPDIDIEETDDAVVVRAEPPGLSPEDFSVEVAGERLIMRGEKRQEHEERKGDTYIMERRYGSFIRSIPLPSEVDPDRAKSEFRDGVLRLTLPKTEKSRGRRIRVDVK